MGNAGISINEGNGDNNNKESLPPVRRLTPIISLIPCEEERANVGRTNPTANAEEQNGIDDADENDKGRNDANCQQEKDKEVRKD
jgi:hypothetical protein